VNLNEVIPLYFINDYFQYSLSIFRHLIEEDGILQGGCLCTYVEIPKELSIEIDTTLDLAFAEQIRFHLGLKPTLEKCENNKHNL